MTNEPPSTSERAAKAKQRVEELNRRRTELAAGELPSAESVGLARQRAHEAMQRAEHAYHAAAQRHEELARVHERTADSYQRAALQGFDGSPEELQRKADQHWQAAHESHLRGIEDEAQAENPKKSSSGGA
jgi:t-SNARE complex subunit (syntaxin)